MVRIPNVVCPTLFFHSFYYFSDTISFLLFFFLFLNKHDMTWFTKLLLSKLNLLDFYVLFGVVVVNGGVEQGFFIIKLQVDFLNFLLNIPSAWSNFRRKNYKFHTIHSTCQQNKSHKKKIPRLQLITNRAATSKWFNQFYYY